MKDIIRIEKQTIGTEEINSANAEDIYEYLEVKTAFTTWFNRCVSKYDFAEDTDFISILKESNGGRPAKQFIVSIDMAKELCMISDTEKGREVRKYFIQMEKQALQQVKLPTVKELALMVLRAEEEKEQALLAMHKAEDRTKQLIFQSKKYTATELAGELGFQSAIVFNKQLHLDSIQFKVNSTWKLYSKYETLGYCDYKQMELDNGKVIYQMRWTGKGRDFLLNFYRGNGRS